MVLGPVLRYELITSSRRARYYAARLAYGLVLLLVVYAEYQSFARNNVGQTRSHQALAQFANALFISFAGWQGGMLLLMIPALVSGVIAEEAQRKTLHDLLASGLSSRSIVMGKLGARLLHAGVVVVIGLPVVALIGLFGGLDPLEVLYVYAATFALMLFVGALAMLVSIVSRKPREAILTTYLLVAAWLILPPMMATIIRYIAWPFSMLEPVNQLLLASHPMTLWSSLNSKRWMQSFGPLLSASIGYQIDSDFLWLVALLTTGGVVFLILAIVLLRPVRGYNGFTGFARRQRPRRERIIRDRPGCGDRPMLWKERRVSGRGGLTWFASLPVVLVLGTLLGCWIFEAARPAMNEVVQSVRGRHPGDSARIELNETIRTTCTGLFILWGLALSSAAAVGFTAEREGDTWLSLNATMLTRGEIVFSKIFGALWSTRRLLYAIVVVEFVGLISGAIHPVGAILAGIGLVIYGWFAASLGVYVSLRARNSIHALVMTAMILLALTVGLLIVGNLVSDHGNLNLVWGFASSPAVEYLYQFSYRDFQDLAQKHYHTFGTLKHNLVAVLCLVVLSFTAHGLAALWLNYRSLRAYDRLVDRPRQPFARPRGLSLGP